MKYPKVLFFRYDKYSYIDKILESDKIECTIEITNNPKELIKLYDTNYHVLVTFGDTDKEYYYDVETNINSRFTKKWLHYTEIKDLGFISRQIISCYAHNVISNREMFRPTFSLFTTCYNSYDKIKRAYKSIKEQPFRDWEWVILDDSNGDEHFKFLNELFDGEPRIRLYKRSKNSGNIGNVKNEAISLCRGKYLLEMDHDDEIINDLLTQSVIVFEKYPEVGFIYTNFINIYENGDNFKYDDFYGKGYCGYYCEKYNEKWTYVSSTSNINNITGTHLVCMPNHPRIWRKDVLIGLGSYCEFLPICDDQEIIMRTFLNTKIAKIHLNGYVQYMNNDSNNFSLIRNYEINKIGPLYLYPQFYKMYNFHEKMKEKDAYEDEKYSENCSQLWKREDFEHKYCNLIINLNCSKQYCIIGINALVENIEKIRELYKDESNDFLLLENTHEPMFWCKYLEFYGFSKMKCYSMTDCNYDELKRFFLLTYKSCDNYDFITHNIHKLDYNIMCDSRVDIINLLTKPSMKYVEIGVEYGQTFKDTHFKNKVGVDPDPKCDDKRIVKLTSDDFFAQNNDDTIDVIFIDGMHQVEYVLRDFNNSINSLDDNGLIFIDDILPINHNEQLKVPNFNYNENNILKYGEPWTGDVWKVVYWILLNYTDNFKLKYFNHANYRGVGVFYGIKKFNIDLNDVEKINNINYFKDFNNYTNLLHNKLLIE